MSDERPLTTVESHGQMIKHLKSGTLGKIVGNGKIAFLGKDMQGFRVLCLDDNVERLLPFSKIDGYVAVKDPRPECEDALNCSYNGPATFCPTDHKKLFCNCPYPTIKAVGEK